MAIAANCQNAERPTDLPKRVQTQRKHFARPQHRCPLHTLHEHDQQPTEARRHLCPFAGIGGVGQPLAAGDQLVAEEAGQQALGDDAAEEGQVVGVCGAVLAR